MDRLKELQDYIGRWYMGEPVLTVRMHSDPTTDLCIQSATVELLRDFIDNPIPQRWKDGSQELAEWVNFSYHKVTLGMNFGFGDEEVIAVKNLAFNYFVDGIRKVQSDPKMITRLYKCHKYRPPEKPIEVKHQGRPFYKSRLIVAVPDREPDFIIGGKENPYIKRWWMTERAADKVRVYLHNQKRDDDDRALHDHPAHNTSIIISGGYWEHLPGGVVMRRLPGQVIKRKAEDAHRLELFRDLATGAIIESWSLFIFHENIREWGFHCPKGWVPWQKFVAEDDPGSVGKGCD